MAKMVSDKLYSNLKLYMSEEELRNYEADWDIKDDAAIVEYVREYYNKILPIDVMAWRQVNRFLNRDDEIQEQIDFMLSQIAAGFYYTTEDCLPVETVQILGTHLAVGNGIFPIFQLNMGESYEGLEIVAICMGKEWVASFKCNEEIEEIDVAYYFDADTFNGKNHLPKDKIYGNFADNKKQFTCKFNSKYDFYTFCMLVKNSLSY